jgi:hypothetical protein
MMESTTTQERTYSPRYATKALRDRNVAYIRKYYHFGGGKERKMIDYYFKHYPELVSRKCYEESDDVKTRLIKIKDEITIIKMERKLKMRVVVVTSTDEDTSSEKSDD